MNQKEIKRGKETKLILIEGKYYDSRDYLSQIFKNKRISGVIRILDDEYDSIDIKKRYIDHFNLEVSNHEVNKIYVLPKILKNGYFTKEKEVLPNLTFKNIIIGKCVLVKENLSYEDLENFDFEFSFEHIKNIDELKKIIFDRYNRSMPELSKREILDLGVSLTRLEILRN